MGAPVRASEDGDRRAGEAMGMPGGCGHGHTAIVGLVAEEESVIVLTLVIHLASNADAVIVNTVCGDDLMRVPSGPVMMSSTVCVHV